MLQTKWTHSSFFKVVINFLCPRCFINLSPLSYILPQPSKLVPKPAVYDISFITWLIFCFSPNLTSYCVSFLWHYLILFLSYNWELSLDVFCLQSLFYLKNLGSMCDLTHPLAIISELLYCLFYHQRCNFLRLLGFKKQTSLTVCWTCHIWQACNRKSSRITGS